MKKKHIKESERYSIIQEDYTPVRKEGRCWACKRYLRKGEGASHEVFWGTTGNRQKSMDYGLVVRLCFNHHDRGSVISVHHNPKGVLNRELQQLAKKKFIETYPNEDFLEVFGKNYEDTSEEY